MAAPMETYESYSSSFGSSEDGSSSSEGEGELKISSFAHVYKSIKSFLDTDQLTSSKELCIFNIADAAVIQQDFVNSLKLYSLGLQHLYKESRISALKHSNSERPDDYVRHISLNKELLNSALVECCRRRYELCSKHFRHSLARTLDSIVEYCDLMSLVDVTFLQNVASLYFNLKEKKKAFKLSSRALQLNPKSLSLQELFENMCCHLVERWHFIMLNDYGRNYAYKQAIEAVLVRAGEKQTVCDIGCGTGLLSLIVSQQPNIDQIFAIDKSSSMCDVAGSVFAANLDPVVAGKLQIINKMSSEMSVPEDMPRRADILVTETFDAGLFGEGILQTLCHAWKHLLNNNGLEKSQIIPLRARLYMQALECDAILQESRFLGNFDGLDTSGIHIYGSAGLCESEPYTAHDLKHLPGGYITLSEPMRLMDVNFNNPQELQKLRRGVAREKTLKMTINGRLDAVAVWFKLHLNEDVVISTHTDSNGCWEQAVFPVHPVKVRTQPLRSHDACSQEPCLSVQTDDVVTLMYGVVGNKLCLEVTAVNKSDENHLCHNHSVPQFLSDPGTWRKHSAYCLGLKEVKTLNNVSLHAILYERVQELHALLKKDNSETDFIHLNDGYSPLCLQVLKLGCAHTVLLIRDQNQKALLQKMAAQNNIDMRKLTLLEDITDLSTNELDEQEQRRLIAGDSCSRKLATETAADAAMKSGARNELLSDTAIKSDTAMKSGARTESPSDSAVKSCASNEPPSDTAVKSGARNELPSDVTRKWLEPCLSKHRNAIVMCDLIDTQGRLVEDLQCQEEVVRYHLSKYATKVITPHRVDVCGMLVDSEHLLRLSRVQSDNNTLGFNIGSFMNRFATRNHQDFLLDKLPHTKLTEPFKMFTINVYRLFGIPEPGDNPPAEQSDAGQERIVTDETTVLSHPLLSPAVAKIGTTSLSNHLPSSELSSSSFSLPILTKHNSMTDHSHSCRLTSSEQENHENMSANSSNNKMGKNPALTIMPDFSLSERPIVATEEYLERKPDLRHCIAGPDIPRLDVNNEAAHSGIDCPQGTKRNFKEAHLSKGVDEEDSDNHTTKQRRLDRMDTELGCHLKYDLVSEGGELTQNVKLKIPITQSGNLTAMIYWFELHISSDLVISTIDPAHHWHQAAVMSLPSQNVPASQGDKLNLFCQMHGSAISFLVE